MTQDSAPVAEPPIPLPAPEPAGVAVPPARAPARVPALAVAFVVAFGALLTSFPARNADLWKHLAGGRDVLRAGAAPGPTWLYDAAAYVTFSVGGGGGLVAAKALLCAAVGALLLRLSAVRGWYVPLAVTGLAVLAMSSRLLLQSATASVLFLALTMWLLFRGPRPDGAWPGWRLAALFVVWANVDGRFVLGLLVVALVWGGTALDDRRRPGAGGGRGRRLAALAVLVAASCLSPAHVGGLSAPPELRAAVDALRTGAAEAQTVNSPFEAEYLVVFRDSSAALSFYPLLVLGLVSFLLNRRGWRWAWFLPWLGLAAASGVQARMVPFFAVVAGPVTAWNLQEYFAARSAAPVGRRVRFAGLALTGAVAAAFLACAWPGWLQGPPFEPRRWVVEAPPAARAAEFLRRAHAAGVWGAGTGTLHVSPDTLGAVAWFCPEDRGVQDETALAQLLAPDAPPERGRERLRELGVSRAVVFAGDSGAPSRAALDRFLADPDEWPVLHLGGGAVVFGWRDPARAGGSDPYAGWAVDFARLAFRPDESEVAPAAPAPDRRRWWDAFWKPAPPARPPGRDEAALLLRKAEADLGSAPRRHLVAWEARQLGAAVGAAGGWLGTGAVVDGAVRLTLFRPPLPEAPGARPAAVTEVTFALQQQFAFERGQTPVGTVYAAIRAARRAVAENPGDANTYLTLGRAYRALTNVTAERAWGGQVPQLRRVRQVQASAALNRAVALNPRLAQAHFELAQLYLTIGCLDLAVQHLRTYRALPPRRGGPRPDDRFTETVDAELKRLSALLDARAQTYERDSVKMSVSDRALLAVRLELAGAARDLLLKSDAAAFGAAGTELELDLLLRTGRPAEVLEWAVPEVRGSIGERSYRWSRAQAHAALGEYDAADGELAAMAGPGGRFVAPGDAGAFIGGLVGKAVLDDRPGPADAPHALWRALRRSDFQTQIADVAQRLGLQADMTVVRGAVALEAGDVARAGAAFRAALAFAPDRVWWGGGELEFGGRRIAWAALDLLGASGPRP